MNIQIRVVTVKLNDEGNTTVLVGSALFPKEPGGLYLTPVLVNIETCAN